MRTSPAVAALLSLLALPATADEVDEGGRDPAMRLLDFIPEISFVADLSLAAFSASSPEQLARSEGGAQDPHANGFNLQQLEVSFGKEIQSLFRVDGDVVFRSAGVEVETAYATTLEGVLPFDAQARLGKFFTRFGRLNSTHAHTWDFVDQPFALTRVFGPAGNRGVGVELSQRISLARLIRAGNPYVELIGSVTDAAARGATRSFAGSREGFTVQGPLDFQYTLALQQYTPLSPGWVLWGLSAANGPNGVTAFTRTSVLGANLQVQVEPVVGGNPTPVGFQAEMLLRTRDLTEGQLLRDWSGYALVSWDFREQWAAALRYELGTPARGRGGVLADDYLDPYWTRGRQRVAGSVTYRPNEFSRFRAQLSADFAGWEDQPNVAGFVAFEFSIGAHGP